MALTRELNEMACRLGKCAVLARSDAMRDLERSVYGCDYGSTGGTTRLEAERIAQLLELRPGAKLLDVGAGSGWPGLYLAQLTGCDVVMVDLPLAALRIARERAAADDLAERCEAVAADGAALPFRDASFDALNHSDVLCCTPDKLGVLRACRRVARDGSRIAFTIIALAPSLADSERQIAMESGPKFVDIEDDYAVLLGQSGWCLQERTDVTAALLQSMRGSAFPEHDRRQRVVMRSSPLSAMTRRSPSPPKLLGTGHSPRSPRRVWRACRGRHDGFTASNEMLFTPNFLLAPRALSEMNW